MNPSQYDYKVDVVIRELEPCQWKYLVHFSGNIESSSASTILLVVTTIK